MYFLLLSFVSKMIMKEFSLFFLIYFVFKLTSGTGTLINITEWGKDMINLVKPLSKEWL